MQMQYTGEASGTTRAEDASENGGRERRGTSQEAGRDGAERSRRTPVLAAERHLTGDPTVCSEAMIHLSTISTVSFYQTARGVSVVDSMVFALTP